VLSVREIRLVLKELTEPQWGDLNWADLTLRNACGQAVRIGRYLFGDWSPHITSGEPRGRYEFQPPRCRILHLQRLPPDW